MITWGALAQYLPLIVVVFMAGAVMQRLRAVEKSIEKLDKSFVDSAKSQGKRIGNVESYLGLNADGIPVERLGGGFSGRVRTNPKDEGDE